jgi:3-methyladenine DNA glycosylase AlkD
MKPLAKKLKNNQQIAEDLYGTGNFDAMYLAGMIANVKIMKPEDFDRWMSTAYFPMISNFIVAVTLAETDFAQEVADRFIRSHEDLTIAAGWSCYEWLLGSRKDAEFDAAKIAEMLAVAESQYASSSQNIQKAMIGFVKAVGISYIPLHEEALTTAEKMNPKAFESIKKEIEKGRLGFKRRNVRC